MPKFIPTFGGYSGPKPVLHIIAGTLILSALAWLAIQLAIVGFGPQINNGVNAQAVSINNTIYDYQWRLIGMAGALAASYYAARWPMSRSATFMAFMATITIALSFIPVDLKGNYQVLYYGIGRCANQGIDSKWCALQMGSQILSDVQTGLVLLLAMWAFARHLVADTYPHLVGSEHFSHILVWLGFAAYACWCGAAAVLNIDLNVDGDTAEFINQWNQPALHIASIAGLTLGAYVSWGSTRGARVNALLFSVVALHILAPAIAWDARMLWDSTYFPGDAYASSCTASFSNRLCLAKNAVVAGIGGVAGVFLVLSLNYVLLLATPVRGDVYAYNQPNAAAVKQEPEYVPANSNNYQASTTQQAAYPSYDTAPAYGTPSNRYVASTTSSPYPPV